jgi:plastocyanin
MRTPHRSTILLTIIAGLAITVNPIAANPRKQAKPKSATASDVERLDKRIDEQQRQIDRLIKLQQLYQQALNAALEGTATQIPVVDKPVAADKPAPAHVDKPPVAAPEPKPAPPSPPKAIVEKKPKKEEPPGNGTIVGKVTGVADAIVYIEDIVAPVKGTAAMKQEDKQFIPRVLVVAKGTTVSFPNRDAIFHNVFSVTPDNSFDLGSYKQGESRSVTMNRPGVVTVYCNMHPQMSGHILVVPNGNYVRAGKDGFFRLPNVPAGTHRVVAWAPNAKPTVVETDVETDQVATIEMSLTKGRATQHTKKDGLPYGSYEK